VISATKIPTEMSIDSWLRLNDLDAGERELKSSEAPQELTKQLSLDLRYLR